jgi:predicted nucleic acid-binding protein
VTVALRLVLDSMVWAQAAGAPARGPWGPSAEIVHLALAHQFELLASSHVREETLSVLCQEPWFQRRLAPGFEPGQWFDETLAACGELIDVTGPPVLQQHAKDDPILWLAAAGGASHLVTWEGRLLDLKHYRFAQVVTPPAFLRAWRHPSAHEPLAEWRALRSPDRLPGPGPRVPRLAAAATAAAT